MHKRGLGWLDFMWPLWTELPLGADSWGALFSVIFLHRRSGGVSGQERPPSFLALPFLRVRLESDPVPLGVCCGL